MNATRLLLSALLFASVPGALPANELHDYLSEAARNNPGLEASFSRWKAALEKIPQVKALPDPRFTFSHFIEEVETRVGPQQQTAAIAQTFPWFGKLKLRSEAAMEAAEARRQIYEQEKLRLFQRVKSAFFEYAYLSRSINITRQHLLLLQNIEENALTRLKTGASQSAAVQAQMELGSLEDKLTTLEALRGPLSARLISALNRPPGEVLPWPQPFELTPAGFSDEQAQQWLAASSPELKRLAAMIREEEAGAHLARKARIPDLTLGLSYIQTGEARMAGTAGSGRDPFIASVSINLPIWHGKLKAAEQEAAFRRAAAQNERDETENRLRAELQTALFQFRDAERKINLYGGTLVPKAEQSLEVARESFESGNVSFTSLLDAERVLLEFRLATDRARADREIRLAEIELLTGEVQ